MERLQKVIASSGYCSRRKAEEYILNGQVKVNNEVVTKLGTKVSYEDEIVINNEVINSKEDKEYYLLYKPTKTISSFKDEKNRPTVVDLIKTKARIYPIGRLDYDTTGLLLLTNDGELTNILSHPKNEIEKVYTAKVKGIITPLEFMQIKKGLKIDNRVVKTTYLKIRKQNIDTNTTTITIGIVEGRNHIVKKLFSQINHEVIKLKRDSYAFLDLKGLKIGGYRKLTVKEVKKLYSLK